MSRVYGVTLCDPNYLGFSDEVLFNIAGDYLHVFETANFRAMGQKRPKSSRLFESGGLEGRTVVTASPESITIDFSWAGTHAWVHAQIYHAETLIAEVYKRNDEKGVIFNADISRVQELSQEIREYIEKFCVPPALSADDLIRSGQQICEDLRL